MTLQGQTCHVSWNASVLPAEAGNSVSALPRESAENIWPCPWALPGPACTPTLHCVLTACAHSRKQAMAEPSVTSSTQPSTPTPWPRAVLWRWWALAPALGLNPTSLTHPSPQADFSRACTVEYWSRRCPCPIQASLDLLNRMKTCPMRRPCSAISHDLNLPVLYTPHLGDPFPRVLGGHEESLSPGGQTGSLCFPVTAGGHLSLPCC